MPEWGSRPVSHGYGTVTKVPKGAGDDRRGNVHPLSRPLDPLPFSGPYHFPLHPFSMSYIYTSTIFYLFHI